MRNVQLALLFGRQLHRLPWSGRFVHEHDSQLNARADRNDKQTAARKSFSDFA